MAQSGYTPILIYGSGTATNVPLAANLTSSASGTELALNYADGKLFYKDSGGVVQVLATKGAAQNSISFGTTGLTPNTATQGAVTVAGTLITSNGGTGLSSYTAGDLPYYASGTALSKLGIGTNGYILQSTGSAPTWVNPTSVIGGAGGSNTQVQYNSSGSLAGSANFTFNGTTLSVTGGGGNTINFTDGTTGGSLYAGSSQIGLFNSGDTNGYVIVPASNYLYLATNGSERMRIDSSGNVGINCAPSAWNSSFKALQISGYLSAWSAGASNQFIYANAYYSNTADTYYANGYAQRIIMSSNSGGYTFADSASGTAGGAITWVTTLALSKDKTVVLQGASQSTGIGIAFPATQSASSDANTLDDYEEGTFTPTWTNVTVGNGASVGSYTKVGNLVNLEITLNWGSTTALTAGLTSITNLPFVVKNQASQQYAVAIGACLKQGVGWYTVSTTANGGNASLNQVSVSGNASVVNSTNPATWANADYFTITFTYQTT